MADVITLIEGDAHEKVTALTGPLGTVSAVDSLAN